MNQKTSTFTGGNWSIIWRSFLLTTGTAFSFFIALPWLLSWFLKWYFDNTSIDGKQMRFDASGSDLIFFLVYLLITIVTFGIGGLFLIAWVNRKTISFIHFNEIETNDKIIENNDQI